MDERNCDIIMGYRCNNNCMHCIRGKESREINLSKNEIIKLIDQTIKRGTTRLILQGGEPTIRDDLFEIIKYAKGNGIREVQIQTNGRMFSYQDFTEEISTTGVDEFCISVHGHNELVHDQFTRVPGSFSQTINGIKNLIELKQNVKILLIITKKNDETLVEIIKMLEEIGVRRFQIGIVNPGGNALEKFKEVVPQFSEIEPDLKKCLSYMISKGLNFKLQDFPKCFVKEFSDYVLEDNLPSAEKLYPEKEVLDSDNERRKNKSYSKYCKDCAEKWRCEGVYKEYLNNYGEEEFFDRKFA